MKLLVISAYLESEHRAVELVAGELGDCRETG
jgi:hypothetical protein